MSEWISANSFYIILLGAAAGGGLVSFLFACKKGFIKNNKHCRKAILDIVGGSMVGFFVALPAPGGQGGFQVSMAFCGGTGWCVIVNVIRRKITDIVEGIFFGQSRGQDIKKDNGE